MLAAAEQALAVETSTTIATKINFGKI